VSTQVSRIDDEDAPTTELLTSAVGDRCTSCQAPLASDQRYCVSCGARRGRLRFSNESLVAQASPAPVQVPERTQPRSSRVSAATTLVAGVATLLLAMGVGVLIGHNNAGTPLRAAAPQVITVGGGPATTPTAGAASAAVAPGSAKKPKVTVVHLTARSVKAAAAAATKVLGSSAPKNPTVTTGQSCSAGTAGCQGGHFTGGFFGP
jgi:hypothetical protein